MSRGPNWDMTDHAASHAYWARVRGEPWATAAVPYQHVIVIPSASRFAGEDQGGDTAAHRMLGLAWEWVRVIVGYLAYTFVLLDAVVAHPADDVPAEWDV